MIQNRKKLMDRINTHIVDKKKYIISKDRNGAAVLKAHSEGCDFYINSKYNSEKESIVFAEENYTESENIFIYGLGMGGHIKALSEMLLPAQKLYILECNINIIKTAFENTKIEEALSKENIIFMGTDSLEESLLFSKNAFSLNSLSFIYHEPSVRAMPESVKKLKELFESYIIRIRSSKILGNLLSENHSINITKNYENGGIKFKDAYKGKPCIIVSAGPSLELNVSQLKNVGDKALILTVGRAWHFLKKNGVRPDFCIITDAKHSTFDQLDKEETEIPLFFLSTITPLVEHYKGPKYILFEKYTADNDKKEYSVETGGSVATTALSLAYLMGCSPLILIGQDLCYHSDKNHSGESSGFIPLKTNKRVTGIDGEMYNCPQNLYEYLKWFERFAENHTNAKLINCTANLHGR